MVPISPAGQRRCGVIAHVDKNKKYAVIRIPGDKTEYITTDTLQIRRIAWAINFPTEVTFVPQHRGGNSFAVDLQWDEWSSPSSGSLNYLSVFGNSYSSNKLTATVPPKQPAHRPPSTFYDFGASYIRNQQSNLTSASSNAYTPTVPLNCKNARSLSANVPPYGFATRQDSNFAAPVSHSSTGVGFSANQSSIKSSVLPSSVNQENSGQELSEESILHKQLNEWYLIPAYFNTQTYPFPCGGFVVPSTTPEKTIMVFTRRLGCIVRPEDPARNGRPYAYFMVCGPGNYRAWEYDEFQPASFKSTKYVNSTEIEMKGYALMAPGTRDMPESSWWAWNDHTGLMRCQVNCARILKKKYSSWEPTCQMVMFDATSIDNGRHWTIKTLSYIDYQFADKQKVWPQQAYYVDDLDVLPKEEQRNPGEEIVFYSRKIRDIIVANLDHIRFMPKNHTLFTTKFSAVIITVWGNDGLTRKLQCLMAAPTLAWEDTRQSYYMDLAGRLRIASWNERICGDTALNQESFKLRYQEQQKEVQPLKNNFGAKTVLKPVMEEEEW